MVVKIKGTAVLNTDISPLDTVKENPTLLGYFSQRRGMKKGTPVNVEVVPMTLEHGMYKISSLVLDGFKEVTFVPEEYLDELSVSYEKPSIKT